MEHKILDGAQTLTFERSGTVLETPAYYFTDFSPKDQIDAANYLAAAAKRENKFLAYELGYGTSLSPLDCAGAGENRVVLAFDTQGQFPGGLKDGSEAIKLPSQESGSLAAFFKLDIRDLIKSNNYVKADLVYSIVPFPNLVSEMLKAGLQLSDDVYVVPNPLRAIETPADEMVKTVSPKHVGELLRLTKQEIEVALGTSKSSYLITEAPDEKIPVIHAHLPQQSVTQGMV
jgi:hypothetical protein